MKSKSDNNDIKELKLELKIELKRELKAELTTDFKEELANQWEDIIVAANKYATNLNSNLQEVVKKQMTEFFKLISMTLTGEEEGPRTLALPPSSSSTPPNMQ